ncbi:50S ribosomal protein L11 methyltransferase [Parasphingorhabdus halotolerans]|uniref:Ribosomal protein L11 methyltransferase n=1 Tax=Parasphingorhabdus halotolerans TaxID=2725558 RepID=A0A6H2DIV4_9SPHN|nr:50S ribosomal protein L11 methyltransferase [Parasphingorhabdus halotolerans]QJB68602.1 50S ribosomal protein L11 methyltransferase [Parasphingorhabdus halotolerans]
MPDGVTVTWKISLPCSRAEAEALAEDNFFIASTDSVPTIVTREDDPKKPDAWAIDVYCDAKPDTKMLRNIAKLVPSTTAKPTIEKLGDEDWVTMSQQGLEPLRAGRFYVHTSNSPPLDTLNIHNICVDAGQAFGTGHHETTMGCLEALDRLKQQGRSFRNIADIGTGTGLLAFAANHLWPHAKIIASDIDIVAVEVSKTNAVANNIKLGHRRGAVRLLQSNGLDSPAFKRRAPFDLIIANILVGPLVSLAPQIAAAAKPGTILILAGLLVHQKPAVVSAYAKAGFRLRGTRLESEWPCLTLVKARRYGRIRPTRQPKSPLAADYFGEC